MSKESIKLTALKTIYLGNPVDPNNPGKKVGHTQINPDESFEIDEATGNKLIATGFATDVVKARRAAVEIEDEAGDADPVTAQSGKAKK